MKKPLCLAVILTLALALSAAGILRVFSGGAADGDRTAARARLENAANSLDAYEIDAVLRPDENALAVTQTLRFTNTTGAALNTLALRFYAGAYASDETSPAATTELFDASYGESFSAGNVALAGAWWNGEVVSAAFSDDAQTVLTVKADSAPGETGVLLLRFTLSIPECAHYFGVSDGVYRFLNVLPILAMYENGAWNTDEFSSVGEPFYAQCANYTFALTVPKGYYAAASAPLTLDNGRYRGVINAARGFSFVVYPEAVCVKGQSRGVSLTAFAATKAEADRALKYAINALTRLTTLYGDAPYDSLTVCALSLSRGGFSAPGLIAYDKDQAKDDYQAEITLARLTAKQWFTVMVGTDGFSNAWQNEAPAEWALLQYVKAVYGADSMTALKRFRVDEPMKENIASSVTPGSPVDYFSGQTEYDAVVRGRGAAFLIAADEMLGGRLNEFLKSQCAGHAFQNASRAEFEKALNSFSSMDLSPLMLDYLDTYMRN